MRHGPQILTFSDIDRKLSMPAAACIRFGSWFFGASALTIARFAIGFDFVAGIVQTANYYGSSGNTDGFIRAISVLGGICWLINCWRTTNRIQATLSAETPHLDHDIRNCVSVRSFILPWILVITVLLSLAGGAGIVVAHPTHSHGSPALGTLSSVLGFGATSLWAYATTTIGKRRKSAIAKAAERLGEAVTSVAPAPVGA